MIVEAYQFEIQNVDAVKLSAQLTAIENGIKEDKPLDEDGKTYYGYTREAVNEKRARDFRGEYIRKILFTSVK